MSINCYCHPNHFECPVLYGDVPGFLDTKPNYPVPAIRQGFEYGQNLGSGEVVLIHWQQGRVDDV